MKYTTETDLHWILAIGGKMVKELAFWLALLFAGAFFGQWLMLTYTPKHESIKTEDYKYSLESMKDQLKKQNGKAKKARKRK